MSAENTQINTSANNSKKDTESMYVIQLSKPYVFEDKEYREIDISGCENLTGNDAANAERIITAMGDKSVLPELSSMYAFTIAHLGTGLPVEFFSGLPLRDATKVKNRVRSCFL